MVLHVVVLHMSSAVHRAYEFETLQAILFQRIYLLKLTHA